MGSTEVYDRQLVDVWKQVDLLHQYNRDYWNEYFTKADFDNLRLAYQQDAQTLQAVKTIHAEFDTPNDTLRRWRNVYFGSMSGQAHWNSLIIHEEQENEQEIVKIHAGARTYQRGLHIVTVDMVNGYESSASIQAAREEATQNNIILAQAEVLSVMGLQRALHKNDQRTPAYVQWYMPYIAGYTYDDPYYTRRNPDWADAWVPRFDHGSNNVGLRVFSSTVSTHGAKPILVSPK